MKTIHNIFRIPNILKEIIVILLRKFDYFTGAATLIHATKGIGSVKEFWDHAAKVDDFRLRVADKLKEMDLDVVLAPYALPAQIAGDVMKAAGVTTSVLIYNLL